MTIENPTDFWRDEKHVLSNIRKKAETANIDEVREIRRELETTLIFCKLLCPRRKYTPRKNNSDFRHIGE